jgi:uncharacterized YigZ family protein
MSYRSILKNNEIKINIKRSEFIGNCLKVDTEDEAKDFIKLISEKYKNANHNCWSYLVNENNRKYFNYSDNGEPSGSAGKPIFGEFQKFDLENIVCVVSRFFGGVKLGVRGLIDAYSTTASKTLKNSKIVEYRNSHIYGVNTNYSQHAEIERLLKRENGWNFLITKFEKDVYFEICIDEEKIESIKNIIEKKSDNISFLRYKEKPYKVRD